MDIQLTLSTDRLSLTPLTTADAAFIIELVNSEGWLKFIGERNVHSETEAIAYIERILSNSNIVYAVVRPTANSSPIGIITFIQRAYLDHPDIGFAFLPSVAGKGYAYEAANAALEVILATGKYPQVLATTIPENVNSIKLLEKLGLHFEKEIDVEKEKLCLFALK